MKTKLIRLSTLTMTYIFVSLQLCAQRNTSIDLGSEKIGLVAPHTESTAPNTFKFVNGSKYKITFTYNGKQISLDSTNPYSDVFRGSNYPTSPIGNVRVDGYPPENYQQFESSWKGLNDLNKKYHEHPGDSEAQLKKAITDCENLIQQYEKLKNSKQVSDKFIEQKLYAIDGSIRSLGSIIKSHQTTLEQIKRDANKTMVSVAGTTSSTKTAQGTTVRHSGDRGQQSNVEKVQNNQSASQSPAVATAAERKADEERVLQIVRQQQTEIARKQQDVAQAATEVGGMFGQAIMANQRLKEEAYEREQAYRESKAKEGNAIIQVYENKARLGDEVAIAQMIKANKLVGASNEVKVRYMNDMIRLHKSPVATSSLIGHYEDVIDTYKRKSKKGIAKTVGAALLTAGVTTGLLYADPMGESEAVTYLTVGAVVGGAIWTISKGMGITRPLQEEEYLNAKSILNRMKTAVTFYPNYDIRTKTVQLALRATF